MVKTDLRRRKMKTEEKAKVVTVMVGGRILEFRTNHLAAWMI